jgi:hypothetical protein
MKNLTIDPETQQKLFELVHTDPCQAFALCVGMPEYFAGCWDEFVRVHCIMSRVESSIVCYKKFASGSIFIFAWSDKIDLHVDSELYITSMVRQNDHYDREIRRIVKDFGQYVLQYYTPTETETENTYTKTETTETETTETPTT